MLGNFLKIDYNVVFYLKLLNSACFFMGMMGLSSKQVGSQATRRVTWRLAWIQPICISINAVPALKGFTAKFHPKIHKINHFFRRIHVTVVMNNTNLFYCLRICMSEV